MIKDRCFTFSLFCDFLSKARNKFLPFALGRPTLLFFFEGKDTFFLLLVFFFFFFFFSKESNSYLFSFFAHLSAGDQREKTAYFAVVNSNAKS